MKDRLKTRPQLIEELKTLRRRVAGLESRAAGSEMKGAGVQGRRAARPRRTKLRTDIEFIGDFDIVRARGVDLSEGGICFEVSECLPFEMQFELYGKRHRHRAHLVWMKRLSTGGYRFGFEFVPLDPFPII